MKKIFVIGIICLAAFGCQNNSETSTRNIYIDGTTFTILTIDGHEYIEKSNGGLCHKQDCKYCDTTKQK